MLDRYLRCIEKDGAFLAGYHQGQSSRANKAYLAEHLRIVRVVSGSGCWRIGQSTYEVRKGDFLLFNNVIPRQIVSVSESPLIYELIGFSTQVFAFDPSYIKLFFSNTYRSVLSAGAKETAEIGALFDLLKRKILQENPSNAVIESLIHAVCMMILEALRIKGIHENEASLPSRSTCEIMEKAIRYIEQHLCEIRDVSEIARYLHISRGHFHKTFTKYIGYTPKHFINHSRVVRFIRLMATCDITVLDAAMQCGFESASGFYKTFRSVCGMSPKEYLSQSKEA